MSDITNIQEFNAEMVRLLRSVAEGIDSVDAEHIGLELAKAWRVERGGEKLGIPAFTVVEKRDLVMADFNGSNHKKVCHEHGISMATLYRYMAA